MKTVIPPLGLLILILITLNFFQGCSPKHQTENSCGFIQNSHGERVSWNKQVPIDIYTHKSFPTDKITALTDSFHKWELRIGRPLFVYKGYMEGPGNPRQDGKNILYWMEDWETNKSTEQGRTTVYWKGDQIVEADIRINHKNFEFYLNNPTEPSDVHLESLLVHELGHVLGLKHIDNESTVMQTHLASHTDRSDVTDFDNHNLICEY